MRSHHHKVLVNSAPKSGTHLAVSAVECLGFETHLPLGGALGRLLDQMPFGRPRFLTRRSTWRKARWRPRRSDQPRIPIGVHVPTRIPSDLVERWLAGVRRGRYVSGHVPYSPELSKILQRQGWRMIVMIRHPLAVLNSFLHHLAEPRRRHPLGRAFRRLGRRERLALAVAGGAVPQTGLRLVGMAECFHSVLGWTDAELAITIRFEDLIGEMGGGTESTQRMALRRLAGHAGVDPDSPRIDHAVDGTYDRQSPTFRTGRIDSWQADFSPKELEFLTSQLRPILTDEHLCRLGDASATGENAGRRSREEDVL